MSWQYSLATGFLFTLQLVQWNIYHIRYEEILNLLEINEIHIWLILVIPELLSTIDIGW